MLRHSSGIKFTFFGCLSVTLFFAPTESTIFCEPCQCLQHNDSYNVIECRDTNLADIVWNNIPQPFMEVTFSNVTLTPSREIPLALTKTIKRFEMENVSAGSVNLESFVNLEKLSLSNLKLRDRTLNITSHLIKEVYATNSGFEWVQLIDQDEHLKVLDLSGNKLIGTVWTTSLEILKLSENRISSSVFTPCQEISDLTSLDLSFNNMTYLHDSLHCILPRNNENMVLNFSHNQIESISFSLFSGIKISHVDLSHNKLVTFDSDAVPLIKVMGTLDLQFNLWSCDCADQWMLNDLLPVLYEKNSALVYDFRCHTPAALNGRPLAYWLHHEGQIFCEELSPYYLQQISIPEVWSAQMVVITIGVIAIAILLTAIISISIIRRNKRKALQRQSGGSFLYVHRYKNRPKYLKVNQSLQAKPAAQNIRPLEI